MRLISCFGFLFLFVAALTAWPGVDLLVSSFFYENSSGFFWGNAFLLKSMEAIAFYGSRLMAIALIALLLASVLRKEETAGLDAKAWGFLLLALLVGPGLIANLLFKDHWGRARPREITEFNGSAAFSPAFTMTDQCDKNCSFISGDGSFGFFLPSFAYVVRRKRKRAVFWGSIIAGCAFGASRIAMGAHFLSDVVSAAMFMLLTSAALHAIMFGWNKTRENWDDFLNGPRQVQ